MHVLGTGVPRCLGVARSALSRKAAQALGFSLTPGLRISFDRVTCMAWAASVPGLWTLVLVGVPGAGGCAGVAVDGVFPPPPLLLFFRAAGQVWFSARSFRGFVVSAAACPGLQSPVLRPPSPFVWAAPLSFFFFSARHFSSRVSAGVSGVSFPLMGRCSRLGVSGSGRAVLRCSSGGPVGAAFVVAWLGDLPVSCGVGAWLRCCVSASCPPTPFFFICAVSLFPFYFFLRGGLPLPPSALPWLMHALVVIRCG